jgi:hypothetical protein
MRLVDDYRVTVEHAFGVTGLEGYGYNVKSLPLAPTSCKAAVQEPSF